MVFFYKTCLSLVCPPVGKFLLMLQSIKRARKVNPDDGELHEAIVGFVMAGMYNKNQKTMITKGMSVHFS